ncbi:MAG TPA: hypothetical protein VN914_19985, partial [Polyangia bacterium]|nr:hypothetical protein [Polyangia bacterium]
APADTAPLPPAEPTEGPAAALLIDNKVHAGGVQGQAFDFKMADHPLSYAIASVHASMLYRSRGIPYSPNAVLAISLKESALCRACAGLTDGCFQIENGGGAASAYGALRQYYPDRFTSDPAQVVGGCHYESSALASAYYSIKTLALLHMHTADPIGFFNRHPDKTTYQKMLNGAYNRGEWWDGMKNAFDNCKTSDVLGCFARASNGAIAVDHAAAIVDYTRALDAAAPFDAPVGEADLDRYWDSIAPLYPPPVDAAAARTALHRAFDARRAGAATLSFRQLRPVLQALIDALPPLPSVDRITARACELQQLSARPPCP